MLERPLSSFLAGAALLLVLVLGVAAALVAISVRQNYNHVVVDLFNVNDLARVTVNCRVALVVDAEGHSGRADLGYLPDDSVITFSVYNDAGGAAWGFRGSSDGEVFFRNQAGHAGGVGFPADEKAIVLSRSFLATGSSQGVEGCDPPGIVAPGLRRSYRQLPEAEGAQKGSEPPPAWKEARPGLGLISAMGAAAPAVMAVLGVISALLTPAIRNRLWGKWQVGGVIGSIALLFALWEKFGWEGLLVLGEMLGIVFLVATMSVQFGTGLRELWREDLSRKEKDLEEDHPI